MNHLNVVVLGDSKSGKSTLLGHLKYQLDSSLQTDVEELKELSTKYFGDGCNLHYAWLLNTIEMSRKRNNTIYPSYFTIKTPKFSVSLWDTPSFEISTKTVFRTINLAHAAILVVDVTKFSKKQAQKYLMAAKSFEIEQIIVCLTKMENNEKNVVDITKEIKSCLKSCGYENKISVIPVSGLEGKNLKTQFQWEENEDLSTLSLFEEISKLNVQKKIVDGPLRISVFDCYKIGGIGTVPVGTVESGVVKENDMISFFEDGFHTKTDVRSIEMNFEPVNHKVPSKNFIGFRIRNVSKASVTKGMVFTHSNDGILSISDVLSANVTIIKAPKKGFRKGFIGAFYCHNSHTGVTVTNIFSKIDDLKSLDELKTGDIGLVGFRLSKPQFIEEYTKCPGLGRFVILDQREIIATGRIISVDHEKFGLLSGVKSRVKYDASSIIDFPIKFRTEKEHVLELMDLNPRLFKYLSDKLKEDINFVWKVVDIDQDIYPFLSDDLKSHPQIQEYMLSIDPSNFMHFHESIKEDPKTVKLLLKQHPGILPFLSDRTILSDDELRMAISKEPFNFKYATTKLQNDQTLIMEVVSKNGLMYSLVPPIMRTKEIKLAAVKNNGYVLSLFPEEDKDFVIASVKTYPKILRQTALLQFLENIQDFNWLDFMLECAKQNGECIDFMTVWSEDLVREACKTFGDAILENRAKKILPDKNLLLLCLPTVKLIDKFYLSFIYNREWDDDFLKECIKLNVNLLGHLPSFLNDREFVLSLCSLNGSVYSHLSNELKSDIDVIVKCHRQNPNLKNLLSVELNNDVEIQWMLKNYFCKIRNVKLMYLHFEYK